MEPVLPCIRLTTPNIQTLKYPTDAEAHFEELRPWFGFAAQTFMAELQSP